MRNLHSHGRLAFGASLAQDGKRRQGLGVNLRNQKVLAAAILLPNLADLDLFRGHSTTLDTIPRSVNNRPRLCFATATPPCPAPYCRRRGATGRARPFVAPACPARPARSRRERSRREQNRRSKRSLWMSFSRRADRCEVTHGRPLPHFDLLLPCHDCGLARRRSRISRHPSPHCPDLPALDRHRAWHSPFRLDRMGGAALLRPLAASHDIHLALSAWLGSDHLRNF